MMSLRPHRFWLAWLALGACAGAAAAQPQGGACERAIVQTERRYPTLPSGLLDAIARVESGRRMPDGSWQPWPLAINLDGAAYYFDSVRQAVELVQFGVSRRRSVDIGCMQISLLHHPQAFGSHADGLDPERNVDYAARFLLQLRERFGTWTAAIAHYHSGDQVRQVAYLDRVSRRWGQAGSTVLKAGSRAAAATLARTTEATSARAAEALLAQAIRVSPDVPPERFDAVLVQARGLFHQGDMDGAERLCATVPPEAPQYREALYCRALAAEARGDHPGAMRTYLTILVDHPADGGALTSLARLAANAPASLRDWEKSARWRQAEDALPTLLTLARSPLPQAPEYLARAQKLAADKGDVRAQLLIAMTYEGNGQPELARKAYQDLLGQLGNERGSLSDSVRERLDRLPPPPAPPPAARGGKPATKDSADAKQ